MYFYFNKKKYIHLKHYNMNRPKVLIVDDLAYHRLLLAKYFIKLHIDYNEACNGKEAFDKIIENNYDLVFMDIEMPIKNGIDTIKEIREDISNYKNQIPVIALTGHDPVEFESNLKKIGFNDILSKPYNFDKLQEILEKFKIKFVIS